MKQPDRLSRSIFWLAITVVCLVIPGCGPLGCSNAVPVAAEKRAVVLELPEARYWGDGDPAAFRQAMVEAFFREQALFRAAGNSGDLPRAEFLAISGGGEDGAFGAGLLVGSITDHVLDVVTGKDCNLFQAAWRSDRDVCEPRQTEVTTRDIKELPDPGHSPEGRSADPSLAAVPSVDPGDPFGAGSSGDPGEPPGGELIEGGGSRKNAVMPRGRVAAETGRLNRWPGRSRPEPQGDASTSSGASLAPPDPDALW